MEVSPGGVSQGESAQGKVCPGGVSSGGGTDREKKLSSAVSSSGPEHVGDEASWHQGLLEICMMAEGFSYLSTGGREDEACSTNIQQDVQEDTAAEGSTTSRGAYARRLEARVFEPANWDRVRQCLVDLGLEHLIGPIDALGVDDLEDFGFLYREDLMEAGATKEEAEAILGCTGAAKEGRPEPPPLARAGYRVDQQCKASKAQRLRLG